MRSRSALRLWRRGGAAQLVVTLRALASSALGLGAWRSPSSGCARSERGRGYGSRPGALVEWLIGDGGGLCPAASATESVVESASQSESAKMRSVCSGTPPGGGRGSAWSAGWVPGWRGQLGSPRQLSRAVPVHRGRHSGEQGVHEHHESSPVAVLRTVAPDRLDAATPDEDAAEVGSDAGAGGALDDGSGLF
jgi:hypothetical protein